MRMRTILLLTFGALMGCSQGTVDESPSVPAVQVRLQLNWFHDPTFAGEYHLAATASSGIRILEGGTAVKPLQVLQSEQAEFAIVGADIFLRSVAEASSESSGTDLVAVFVDFQRNPVGWIVHPEAATAAGFPGHLDGKQRNAWLFDRFADSSLQAGDKRGTETTSIWIQWRRVHRLPAEVNVLPVGFDPSILLSAPKLAYPVYLNEEPFKLGERIGRPVMVFDPADDGIELYGNVVVTRRSYLESNRAAVHWLQKQLREAWKQVKAKEPDAVALVRKVYPDVSDDVLQNQIRRTLEFAFYGGVEPGYMDMSPGGRWAKTIAALHDADLLPQNFDLMAIEDNLYPPDSRE